MPELPEAEIAARKLIPLIKGRKILNFWTDLPKGVAIFKSSAISRDIKDRKIKRVERRGKAILLWLSPRKRPGQALQLRSGQALQLRSGQDDGRVLAFHQKMSGRVLVLPKGTIDKHIHHRFLLSDRQALKTRALSRSQELVLHDVRKFGKIWYGSPDRVLKAQFFARLGKDPLRLSPAEFRKIFFRHKDGSRAGALLPPRGMIKPFLLRQDVLAGIGNIMADESLWKAKIHPATKIERLREEDLSRLFRAIKFVLQKSIQLGGSSMVDWLQPDNIPGGYYERRYVYGRQGSPCPRCKVAIQRIVIGSRGTYFCPKCQSSDIKS